MSFDPGPFFLSLAISAVGFVAFSYGRKQRRGPQVIAGLALMIFPYFVADPLIMIGIAVLLLGAMWLALRSGL